MSPAFYQCSIATNEMKIIIIKKQNRERKKGVRQEGWFNHMTRHRLGTIYHLYNMIAHLGIIDFTSNLRQGWTSDYTSYLISLLYIVGKMAKVPIVLEKAPDRTLEIEISPVLEILLLFMTRNYEPRDVGKSI